MFAWGVCTHSLTGIVCEHVKQWRTSQLTDTLSCSYFEWQQCVSRAVEALVWDSVQTALQADRKLHQRSELLIWHRCSLSSRWSSADWLQRVTVCDSVCHETTAVVWREWLPACVNVMYSPSLQELQVKHSGPCDYLECHSGLGLNGSRCLLKQKS